VASGGGEGRARRAARPREEQRQRDEAERLVQLVEVEAPRRVRFAMDHVSAERQQAENERGGEPMQDDDGRAPAVSGPLGALRFGGVGQNSPASLEMTRSTLREITG
jgi:hypothetical protein